MAAPLPTGARLSVMPQAPTVNPANFVAPASEAQDAVLKGLEIGQKLARLGDLRAQIDLERQQRKAADAVAKAQEAEAQAMGRRLEQEQSKVALAIEQQKLQNELAKVQNPLAIENQRLANAVLAIQGQTMQRESDFTKQVRDTALGQLKSLSAPAGEVTPGPLSTAPVPGVTPPTGAAGNAFPDATQIDAADVPFKTNTTYQSWIRPQVAAHIASTGKPVASIPALAKELGVKRETKSFVHPKSGATFEVDMLSGPAGEVFEVSQPRFMKASVGQTDVDKKFADDVADFVSGAEARAQANIDKLDKAIAILRKPGTIAASGPLVGLLPDAVRKPFTTDETLSARPLVESVVQESLKAILGAQFSQREAEQLLSRSFNPSMSEEANADLVEGLKKTLQNSLNAKRAAVQYFQKHGTLAGSQYSPAVAVAEVKPAAPAASGEVRFDPATGKYYQRIDGVITEVPAPAGVRVP